jgi:hypothetical protein
VLAAHDQVDSDGPREIEIEIVYNNTSKNRLLSLGPPFCNAIQDLEA